MEKSQVFVKIDDYKEVVNMLHLMKSKINEASDILANIEQLKRKEDSELELCNQEIAEIHKKVQFIDKSLLEPEM